MHNRFHRLTTKFRLFSSSSSARSKTGFTTETGEVIRSGGKSSYIGFGKFEGMGGEKGSIQKALEYLRETLSVHKTVERSGENLRTEARFHHDIAMCHHRAGDIESAITEYERGIDILQKLLTETSPTPENAETIKRARFDLSSAYSGLSVAHADKSSDSEALENSLKSLEIRKSMMGANHVSVAECLNNLGGLYFRQSNFNKAAEAYQESLRILLTKTGGKEENKYVALAYYNIGLTYDKLGLRRGVDAVQKALLIANHIWGPDHDQTIQVGQTLDEMRKRSVS